MLLKKLKINGFGNIKEKEIDLKDGINLIYGTNESGKSTLLKFIMNVFYGSSKNKKGKDISDFEQFKPWETETFSGKIEYQLEDNTSYEVFREFKKKNPVIYNQQGEDISKQFTVDKTKGNQFFYEQTKLDEELFLASMAVMQQEVQLDRQNQNMVVQKIANLAGTGDSQISIKRAIDKLNKRQLTEIGTERSQDRPLNKVKEEIERLKQEKQELISYKIQQYERQQRKQVLEEQLKEKREDLEIASRIKSMKEAIRIEEEKCKINEEIRLKQVDRIEELQQEKKQVGDSMLKDRKESRKPKKGKAIFVFLLILLLLGIGITSIIINIPNWIGFYFLGIANLLAIISVGVAQNKRRHRTKQKRQKHEQEERMQNEIEKIDSQIHALQKVIAEKEAEMQIIEKKVQELEKTDLEKMKSFYQTESAKDKIDAFWKRINLSTEIEEIRTEITDLELTIHQIELEQKNILPKLEQLASDEESLERLEEQYQQLMIKNETILLAKEMIEKAYEIMKKRITPQFTEELSKTITNISNGRYQKVRFNNENQLMVELITGEYISVDRLSTGTIDQLYLALRLAVTKQVTKEPVPIILDEAFAYYDENRLENILNYIHEEVSNQVLILTCTNREEKIIQNKEIPYHKIVM